MWPWGHLALGYLCYAGGLAVRRRSPPRGWPVVALAVGTQFPDLVDKPLAYWVGVLPGGRTLAHSVLVFGPVAALVAAIAWRERRNAPAAVAFAVGWGSHLLGDALGPLFRGDHAELTFLLWPALPAPAHAASTFGHHAGRLVASIGSLDHGGLVAPVHDFFVLQLWLTGATVLLWAAQGAPPLPSAFRWLVRGRGGREPSP